MGDEDIVDEAMAFMSEFGGELTGSKWQISINYCGQLGNGRMIVDVLTLYF